jgi:ATP-binding cassette subfamily B protein
VPLPQLSHDTLRAAVAYGFDRPFLLGDTVGEAIGLGGRGRSPEELVAAARAAHADGFIRRLPAGYDTPLAEAPMSGGERQRIGLARAFAQGSRVLLLDDVAASLDTVTEHEISQALTRRFAGRTRLLVAHRASTAARADLVVWLQGGRVRMQATHGELARDPAYRRLFGAEDDPEFPANGHRA